MHNIESKEVIHSLEIWLRNLIDRELTIAHGEIYFDAENSKQQNVIKSQIRKNVEKRIKGHEERYPRKVDALLLDEEIEIICNPVLYKRHFKDAFVYSYPNGNDELRHFLNQIIPIRNKLFYSNPISQREYEKVICYSHDLIDSIKEYYKKINMEKEFNVPSILFIYDSLGNAIHENQFIDMKKGNRVISERQMTNNILRVGEELKICIEIDKAFSSENYEIKWLYQEAKSVFSIKEQSGKLFSLRLKETHIREILKIECSVISDKPWHRFTKYDDKVTLFYKVLPIP